MLLNLCADEFVRSPVGRGSSGVERVDEGVGREGGRLFSQLVLRANSETCDAREQ